MESIESENEEDISKPKVEKLNFFQRTWQDLKAALMGTLFVMANDSQASFKMNVFAMFIDSFQLMAFPFNDRIQFPWNKQYSSFVFLACWFMEMEFYISDSSALQNLTIYLCLVFFVIVNLMNFAIVGYRFINKKVQNVFLLKTLRSVSSLLTTSLYMPFLSIFITILGCAVRLDDMDGCPKDQSWLLIISSIVFSIVLGVMSLIVAASYYELEYTSDDIVARPHARVELAFFVIKGIITFFTTMFFKPEFWVMLYFIQLFCGVTMTYLYMFYLPYYDYRTNKLQTQFLGIFTWSAICLTFPLFITGEEDPVGITLFYIGCPLAWIFVGEGCNMRREVLLKKTIDTVKNPYEVELHTRFLLIKRAGTYKTDDAELLDEIEDFYYQAERKFPRSSILKIFVAQFQLTYKSRQEAISKLDQAEKRNPKLDEQFIIYKTRQNVGQDAITMVTFDSYLESAHLAEVQVLKAQTEFWMKLSESKAPVFDNLTSLSKIITKNLDKAYTYYQYLMKVDRTHQKMLPMYVYFLQDLMNRDDFEVQNLRNRIHDFRSQNSIVAVVKKVEIGNPEVIISSNDNSLGRIDRVNNSLLSWLQYPKSELMNQNISKLMPKPFGSNFLRKITMWKNFWEESYDIAPETLYFVDKTGFIDSGMCKFIVNNDKFKTKNQDTYKSDDFPMISNGNLLGNATPSGNNPSDVSSNHQWPLTGDSENKIICDITISDEEISIIILNSDFKLVHFNKQAHLYFGVLPSLHVNKDIGAIITNFKDIFEKAKLKIKFRSIERLDFDPFNAYVLTPSGRYIRFTFNISERAIEKKTFYIVNIENAPSYSKSTALFLAHFSKVLESFLGRRHTFYLTGGSNQERMENGLKRTKKTLTYLKKHVEEKNKSFSPLLSKLNRVFLVFNICMVSLITASFFVTKSTFNQIQSDLDYMGDLTDIQNYSILLSFFVRLLDASHSDLKMPETRESILQQLDYAALNLSSLATKMGRHLDFEWLQNSDVDCLAYDPEKGYYSNDFNPINSLLQQITYTKNLIKSNSTAWDVEHEPAAYWVFENGMNSIADVLTHLSNEHHDQAYTDRQNTLLSGIWFVLSEVLLVFLLLFFSVPLFIKSEQIHLEVIGAFFSINQALVSYLKEDSLNKLSMRKDAKYPDCRGQYRGGEELWNEIFFSDKNPESGSFTHKRSNLISYNRKWVSRLKLFVSNGLMRTVLIFSLISLFFVLVVQLWIGEMVPVGLLEHSVRIVKYFGTMEVLLTRSNLFLLNTIMSTNKGYSDIIEIDGVLANAYLSIDYSSNEVMNRTEEIRNYVEVLLVGNSSMELTYDEIYTLSKDQFYNEFFSESCEALIPGINCSDLQNVLDSGYKDSVMSFIFETQALAKKTYVDLIDKTVKERWNALDTDLLNNIELEYKYLWLMGQGVKENVLDYFHWISEFYYLVREYILVIWWIVAVLYYLLMFRRALMNQEKKRRLSRSMLLLLPEKIIVRSQEVQEYLYHINLD
ncbi:unnamed protein product [Blepharisma stoltei]|uniref:PAS domain-containing protein n=1 Tax=Blepharisma stoltei TaxID=1481888 RepID=A0AAU9IEW4_9CILI|nr:unnamed protein product [Blepharisma stoltei]